MSQYSIFLQEQAAAKAAEESRPSPASAKGGMNAAAPSQRHLAQAVAEGAAPSPRDSSKVMF